MRRAFKAKSRLKKMFRGVKAWSHKCKMRSIPLDPQLSQSDIHSGFLSDYRYRAVLPNECMSIAERQICGKLGVENPCTD